MPTKLKYLLVFSSLFFAGLGGSWLAANSQSNTEQNARVLASVKNSSTIHMEKHLMPLVLTAQVPDIFPDDPEETVDLKVQIHTPFPQFTTIAYRWILPEDVEVVKGHVTNEILDPVANQVYEAELSIKGFNNLDRKEISLIATTTDANGTQLGNSTVITSRPEDSMEHLAPVMMVKAQEFKASQSGERMPASEDGQ